MNYISNLEDELLLLENTLKNMEIKSIYSKQEFVLNKNKLDKMYNYYYKCENIQNKYNNLNDENNRYIKRIIQIIPIYNEYKIYKYNPNCEICCSQYWIKYKQLLEKELKEMKDKITENTKLLKEINYDKKKYNETRLILLVYKIFSNKEDVKKDKLFEENFILLLNRIDEVKNLINKQYYDLFSKLDIL
jgi:hypothetical protein